jgi:hypothetical protein
VSTVLADSTDCSSISLDNMSVCWRKKGKSSRQQAPHPRRFERLHATYATRSAPISALAFIFTALPSQKTHARPTRSNYCGGGGGAWAVGVEVGGLMPNNITITDN